MDGWYQLMDERPWFQRDTVVGPLTFRMDVWPADTDCTEWNFSFQGYKAQNFVTYKSPEAAMKAATTVLADYLRQAARALSK